MAENDVTGDFLEFSLDDVLLFHRVPLFRDYGTRAMTEPNKTPQTIRTIGPHV